MNIQEIIRKLTHIPSLGRPLDDDVVDAINLLSDADRVQVRNSLAPTAPSPRNLWFNYETQTWID